MQQESEILIIGGGLAGLTAAIHLAKHHKQVCLIEKEHFPKHKVCGEYISNEVRPYFTSLGIDINDLDFADITHIDVSTSTGKIVHSKLPLGGFGISRYTLDHHLYKIALSYGVQVIHDTVIKVSYTNNLFTLVTAHKGSYTSPYVIGAYGKKSRLDTTLRPHDNTYSPWLAIKSHYTGTVDSNCVALHHFEGGYCGISRVENDKINVCYLVHYSSFKRYKNIPDFEKHIIYKNPHLYQFFTNATSIFKKPLSISQISFSKKQTSISPIFMIGDSAGMIHPLCGNGMAMAIQGAQIVCTLILENENLKTRLPQHLLLKQYQKIWQQTFSKRLYTGRVLQKIVIHPTWQKLAYNTIKVAPVLLPKIIRQTHGKPMSCS